MKRAVNILLFIGLVSGFAQETHHVFSVYFTSQSLEVLTPIPNVNSIYQKRYQLSEQTENKMRLAAGEFLIIDASGIFIQKNKLLFITREQIREESKYEVRNGYIFGVMENDSLPTALEGENYYFLVPSKTYLYETKSGNSILFEGKTTGEYLLMSVEANGHYTPLYLRFSGGNLFMMQLEMEGEKCSCKNINKQELIAGEFDTFILSPSLKEWQQLFNCFVSYDSYVEAK